MDYETIIRAAESNPQQLEQLYRTAKQQSQVDDFKSALYACYQNDPESVLYAAWFYRFQDTHVDTNKPRRGVNWTGAVPLSILTGLIFWALSDFERALLLEQIPHFFLWWSPIATVSTLFFLALTSKKNTVRALIFGLGLLIITAFAVVVAPTLQPAWKAEQYLILAAIHLPLLCWIALGIFVLGFKSTIEDRFAFLIKSIEVMITAGLYLIAGIVFGGITVGMFTALNIKLPDIWMRLIGFGGFGLLPVLAVASVYDPSLHPSAQNFEEGLSKFIATMMHLLLPLTLSVLVIYIFVIPFNFMAPFENRDLLIVYNLMLFAILGLLLGATPIQGDNQSPRLQHWLRVGIIVVASLVMLVSLYAISATVYRTVLGYLTPNRLTIIGWNTINIGVLFLLIYRQFKQDRESWVKALQSVFSLATNAYMIWGLFLLLVVPLLF